MHAMLHLRLFGERLKKDLRGELEKGYALSVDCREAGGDFDWSSRVCFRRPSGLIC
jgi:hypothetical protein